MKAWIIWLQVNLGTIKKKYGTENLESIVVL